jgi:hypothetical protein
VADWVDGRVGVLEECLCGEEKKGKEERTNHIPVAGAAPALEVKRVPPPQACE